VSSACSPFLGSTGSTSTLLLALAIVSLTTGHPKPPTHEQSQALDDRWEHVKEDTDAIFAKYIRANHTQIRLAKIPMAPWLVDAGRD